MLRVAMFSFLRIEDRVVRPSDWGEWEKPCLSRDRRDKWIRPRLLLLCVKI